MRQIPYVQTLILLLLAASLLAGCATSSQEVTDGQPTPIETPLQSAFTPGSFTDGMQRSIKLTGSTSAHYLTGASKHRDIICHWRWSAGGWTGFVFRLSR